MISYYPGLAKGIYDRVPTWLQDLMTTGYGYRLKKRAYGKYFSEYYRFLSRSQYYSERDILEYQGNALREFIQHTYQSSEYWRTIFDDAGIAPDQIMSPEELKVLPVLEKETVRSRIGEIETAGGFRSQELVPVRTSGTTGKALHFNLTREVWERENAFRQLHRNWGGIYQGDKVATLAGHPVVPTDSIKPPFWRNNLAENQLIFSSHHITPSNLPFYASELQHFQPDLIHGYPSSIYLLAFFLDSRGIFDIHPKAVYTHSETLLSYQRELIERVFGCKVFVWYGNAEMVGNIVECEQGSLHVKGDHSIIEFIRPDGSQASPGEISELLCTGFGNYATPLIRYRIGDSAIYSNEECPCGRPGPIVKEILGRIEDIIVTPDGRHVGRLDHAFKAMLNVKEAQIIQEVEERIRVKLVTREEFEKDDLKLIEDQLRLRLGTSIGIEYEFLKEIPREPNGKFRFAISRVPLRI